MMTLMDCIELYKDEHEALKRKSRAWTAFARELVAMFGDNAPIGEVASAASVRKWMAEMGRQQNKPATIKTKLSFLNRLAALATEHGVPTQFPSRLSKSVKVSNWRGRTLSEKEKAALKAELSPADWDVCVIAAKSGMRSQEIFLLKVADCDFRSKMMHVRRTKTGEERWVPMHKEVHALCVKAARAHREYVVSIPGYDHYSSRISAAEKWKQEVFRVALRRAGIDNFRWHDWRHQTATALAEGGADVAEACKVFGWKDPRHFLRYVNVKTSALHKAMSMA